MKNKEYAEKDYGHIAVPKAIYDLVRAELELIKTDNQGLAETVHIQKDGLKSQSDEIKRLKEKVNRMRKQIIDGLLGDSE